MKTILVVLTFLGAALTAAAYQAGAQNRTNFGSNQAAQAGQQNYRSFSTYKQRNWSQGVQTQRVQTETAGKSAVDFEKKGRQQPVGKTQAVAPKATKPAPQAVQTQPSSTTANMPANADPAAMMQQVQNMMNAMGTQTGQPGAPGQAQAGQNAAAMPDISALMGGALPTPMAPAATPAKK